MQGTNKTKRGANPASALSDRVTMLQYELRNTRLSFPATGRAHLLGDEAACAQLMLLETMVRQGAQGVTMAAPWRESVADALDTIKVYINARRAEGMGTASVQSDLLTWAGLAAADEGSGGLADMRLTVDQVKRDRGAL